MCSERKPARRSVCKKFWSPPRVTRVARLSWLARDAASVPCRFEGRAEEGRIPPAWAQKPAKLRQKDRDARWTVKYTKVKPRVDGAPRVDPQRLQLGNQLIRLRRGEGAAVLLARQHGACLVKPQHRHQRVLAGRQPVQGCRRHRDAPRSRNTIAWRRSYRGQRSRQSVVDQAFDRGAGGQDIALAQFTGAGGGFRRGMRRPRRGVALGLPLFPLGQRFLHQLGGVRPARAASAARRAS